MYTRSSVLECYSKGAKERQASLCCPVEYDQRLLAMLPQEIIEKDYGCGDPSRYVLPDDVVLEFGSSGGKICYMAAQLVGEQGQVIGMEMNDDMPALVRKYQGEMAQALDGDRVRFVKGCIEDRALDVDGLERNLAAQPLQSTADLDKLHAWQSAQRVEQPLIADASIDLVISNCAFNLVDEAHKRDLAREIHRVLKPNGRIAISDIVSDEPIPVLLKADPVLWSGCIAGAFQEQEFLRVFQEPGFLALSYDKWDAEPWQVLEGVEFSSLTLTGVKGAGTPCMDLGQAVIYLGPYASTTDDEGYVYPRGERMAVCERTFKLPTEGTYKAEFIGIRPTNH
jgi:arsenite methyltransferase